MLLCKRDLKKRLGNVKKKVIGNKKKLCIYYFPVRIKIT